MNKNTVGMVAKLVTCAPVVAAVIYVVVRLSAMVPS